MFDTSISLELWRQKVAKSRKKDDAMSSSHAPIPDDLPEDPITWGQIGRLNDRFLEKCRKNVRLLPRSVVQEIIEHEGDDLIKEWMNALLARVEKRLRSWHKENGVIYFSVTSDGTTGEQWITKLEVGGKRVGNYAKQLLRSEKFKPTSRITYNIVVIKGEVFSDNDRYTSNIRAEAKRRKFTTPPAELACLIRQKFPDADIEKMGLLWIVTFHEPIGDSGGGLGLLSTSRRDGYALYAYWDYPDHRWDRGYGLAFLVSQVSA